MLKWTLERPGLTQYENFDSCVGSSLYVLLWSQ